MLTICNEEFCIKLDTFNVLYGFVCLFVCQVIVNLNVFFGFTFLFKINGVLIGFVFCWINTFLFLKIEIQFLLSLLIILFWSTVLEMALLLPQKNRLKEQ